MAYNPKWNVLNRIIDGDSRIYVTDSGSSNAIVQIDGVDIATFTGSGLQMATGATVNEFSTDGTLSGDVDTAIPTEKAVKTYVDTAIANLNPDKIWEGDSYVEVVDLDGTGAGGYVTLVADGNQVAYLSDTEQRFGKTDDNITFSDSTAEITAGSVEAMTLDENGLKMFSTGATVNEFSTDGTLADDSDTALPTEQAVKTYVDAQIAATSYQITAGDSYVRVNDSTGEGNVEVVVDGVQVQYWDDEATTIRMGKSSGAGRVVVNDTEVTAHVGSSEVFDVTATAQRLGVSTDTYIQLSQTSDNILFRASAIDIGEFGLTSQRIGVTGDSRVVISQAADTVDIYAGTALVVDLADNTQQIGVSADTFLLLTQDTNTVDLRANNVSVLNATDTTQRFGASGDTNLTLNTSADTFTLSAGANTHISGALDSLELGVNGGTTIALDQTADSITITAGGESQLLVETTGLSVYEDLTVTGNLYVDGTTWVVHNQEVTTSDNLIVINNGEVGPGVTDGWAGFAIDRGSSPDYYFMFSENTDTFRIGESTDSTSYVGLQAVATREDSPTDMVVPWWNDTAKRFDTLGSSSISVNTTTDVITITSSSSPVATFESDGLTLANGTNINEFSTDTSLGGDSDDAVPTEAAVKAYVDAQIGGSADKIWEGDSYVEVVDDGTNAGYITIVADGVEVGYFDAEATSQRLGKAPVDGGFSIVTADASAYIQDTSGNNLANFTQDVQRVGLSGDTYLQTTQSSDNIVGYANNVEVLDFTDTSQRIGDTDTNFTLVDSGLTKTATLDINSVNYMFLTPNADSLRFGTTANNIDIAPTGNTVTIDANSVEVANFAETTQRIGVSTDTNIALNQTANTIVFEAANTTEATIDTNGLTLKTGASVNEFSIDGTLADDSDDAVPTEKAVKLYVDTAIANLNPDKIWEGDSYVEVVDDGTAAGYVTIVADGVEVAHYDASGSSQRMGKAAGAGRILVTDAEVTTHIATTEVMSLNASGLQLGGSGARVDTISTSTSLGSSDTTLITQAAATTYIDAGDSTTLVDAQSYADSGDASTLSTANGYTDTEIASLRSELDLINVQYIYADTTAITGDVLLVDTTAGDVNIELISGGDSKIVVKKVTTDGNDVIITGDSGTIDGKASVTIDVGYQSYHFVSDGTNFFIL